MHAYAYRFCRRMFTQVQTVSEAVRAFSIEKDGYRPDQVVTIPAGSRLRLTLAATSTAQNPANALYLLGVRDGSRVRLARISVTLPVLKQAIS